MPRSQGLVGPESSLPRRRSKRLARLWPYQMLSRDDDEITSDLRHIVEHFAAQGRSFDVIVFIPNAGVYLSDRFKLVADTRTDIQLVKVRNASTVSRPGPARAFIFRHRTLADAMRHVEVLAWRIRYALRLKPKKKVRFELASDPRGKRVLVIDDAVDTGTTMRTVRQLLRDRGASEVATACISSVFALEGDAVDYAVYRHRLLRTKDSGDYRAG